MSTLTGSKGFLTSKGVWGGLISIIPMILTVLSLVGIKISADDANAAVSHVEAIIAAVGGILAIYGRVTATKTIG